MAKCKDCKIFKELQEDECCAWFIDNFILGDKDIKDCTAFIPYEEKGGEG